MKIWHYKLIPCLSNDELLKLYNQLSTMCENNKINIMFKYGAIEYLLLVLYELDIRGFSLNKEGIKKYISKEYEEQYDDLGISHLADSVVNDVEDYDMNPNTDFFTDKLFKSDCRELKKQSNLMVNKKEIRVIIKKEHRLRKIRRKYEKQRNKLNKKENKKYD